MILLKQLKIEVDTDLKITLLDHRNNYVGNSSMMSNAAKSFDIPAISLSVLHNYFDGLTKLFSNLYLTTFLDVSVKLLFPYFRICILRIGKLTF